MLPFEDKFSRQRRLAEVGPRGQSAIETSSLAVADYPGQQAELAYLQRAGAAVRLDANAAPTAFAHAHVFQHEVARDYAWGAWSALDKLRHVIRSSHGTS